jgi:hypothetical protein
MRAPTPTLDDRIAIGVPRVIELLILRVGRVKGLSAKVREHIVPGRISHPRSTRLGIDRIVRTDPDAFAPARHIIDRLAEDHEAVKEAVASGHLPRGLLFSFDKVLRDIDSMVLDDQDYWHEYGQLPEHNQRKLAILQRKQAVFIAREILEDIGCADMVTLTEGGVYLSLAELIYEIATGIGGKGKGTSMKRIASGVSR